MIDVPNDHFSPEKPTRFAQQMAQKAWERPKQEKDNSLLIEYGVLVVASAVTAVVVDAIFRKELVHEAFGLVDRAPKRVGGAATTKALEDLVRPTTLPDRAIEANLKLGRSDRAGGSLAMQSLIHDPRLVLEDGQLYFRPRHALGMADDIAEPNDTLIGLRNFSRKNDLAIKGPVDPAGEHFIPVKASMWEVLSLTSRDEREAAGAQKVADIKRYVNAHGKSANEYLAGVMNANDITIVGEQHTLEPNYHRIAAADAVKKLPAGSTLAIELPKSLDGVFERFNQRAGVDLETVAIPSKFGNELSQQRSLSLLSLLQKSNPDLIDLLKSARDNGVRVVPIDVELNGAAAYIRGEGTYTATGYGRDAHLASELVALHRAEPSKPVVAWLGGLHGAKSSRPYGHASAAELIAKEPEFAMGEKRLSTVFSQVTEENIFAPPTALAERLKSPVGIPVPKEGQGRALNQVRVVDRFGPIDTTIGDYDHLVMYPKMPLPIKAKYQF